MGGLFGSGSSTPSASPVTSMRLQTSTRGRPVPMAYGKPRIAANLIWYGDLVSSAHKESAGGKGGSPSTTSYTYTAALIMALCEGPVLGIPRVWRDKEVYIAAVDACAQIGLAYSRGSYDQAAPGWMTTKHADEALAYQGLSYVSASSYALSSNADMLNHSFEVDTASGYSATIRDANLADVVVDLLTNPHSGAGFPAAKLGDMTQLSQYCIANNIFISPAYLEQAATRDMLDTLMTIANAGALYSQGKLSFVPFGDVAATANGVTFTPNITPVYDLTDDDFMSNGSDDPIRVPRSSPADAYNSVRIKFYNRENNYNEEIVEAKDQANIEMFGLRAMDVIDMKEICDAATARAVAQLTLQRVLYIRNTFIFTLGWNKALLEPMDLVTLTDVALGMNKVPVRIKSIEEDDDGYLAVTAEEYPLNVCNAATYNTQPAIGYAANFNESPGQITDYAMFEVPIEMATSEEHIDLWVAANGGASFGGCEVWISTDNATYKRMGATNGSSRVGELVAGMNAQTAPGITGESISVRLYEAGQLLSGTLADAHLLNTLCLVGNEFLAYETADLTGVGAYTLTTLNRGAYRSGQAAHPAGAPFVRIDDSVAKIALTQDYIGTTIFVKLPAFNAFGGGVAALADVDAVQVHVSGRFLRIPPAPVTSLSMVVKADGTRSFAFDPGAAANDIGAGGGYRIKYRPFDSDIAWANMTPLHAGLITSSPYETHDPRDGIYDFGIEAVDLFGNESMTAVLFDNVIIGAVDFVDSKAASSVANDVMQQTIAALNAQIAANKAETAQAAANLAIAEINAIASDGVLSAGEKSAVILDYRAILAAQAGAGGIDAQADLFGQSRVAYDAAVAALTVYLTSLAPAYDDATTNTVVVPAAFRQAFLNVYTAQQLLENAITVKAKALADAAQGTASAAAQAAAAAQTAAASAQDAANVANGALTSIASDSILSPGEKPAVILDYSAIMGEKVGIDAQADSLGQSRTAYDNAVTALTNYLGGLAGWNTVPGGDVAIDGPTFRQKFADVYAYRQALLNAITTRAAAIATWSGLVGASGTINTGNSTTIIDPGAVTSGHLEPDAASQMLTAANAGTLTYNVAAQGGTLPLTVVLSVSIQATGRPIAIDVSFGLSISWAGSGIGMGFTVTRNRAGLNSAIGIALGDAASGFALSGLTSSPYVVPVVLTGIDTPAAGQYTYSLEVAMSNTTSSQAVIKVVNSFIKVREIKK